MARKIKYIVVHHSASPREKTTVSKITAWHKSRGWDHIGYHRVIGRDGTIASTLPIEKQGYHVWGRNKDSVGICVAGNFQNEHPIQAQIDNLTHALTSLCKKFGLKTSKIYAHRQLSLPGHATACPGNNLYKLLPGIKKKVSKNLEKPVIQPDSLPIDSPPVSSDDSDVVISDTTVIFVDEEVKPINPLLKILLRIKNWLFP